MSYIRRDLLEKMRHGQLTDEAVAEKTKRSIHCVQKAFVKHCQKKMTLHLKKKDIARIIEVLLSFVSALLVLLTLHEMRTERNQAYMPDIFLSKATLAMSWDIQGRYTTPVSEVSKALLQDHPLNVVPTFQIINLGVGTAKNIKLSWRDDINIPLLTDFLYNHNENAKFQYSIDGGMISFASLNGSIVGTSLNPGLEIPFLLSSDEQEYLLMLPCSYIPIFQEIITSPRDSDIEFPDLKAYASYKDIQGVEYKKTITIRTRLEYLTITPEGAYTVMLSMVHL